MIIWYTIPFRYLYILINNLIINIFAEIYNVNYSILYFLCLHRDAGTGTCTSTSTSSRSRMSHLQQREGRFRTWIHVRQSEVQVLCTPRTPTSISLVRLPSSRSLRHLTPFLCTTTSTCTKDYRIIKGKGSRYQITVTSLLLYPWRKRRKRGASLCVCVFLVLCFVYRSPFVNESPLSFSTAWFAA